MDHVDHVTTYKIDPIVRDRRGIKYRPDRVKGSGDTRKFSNLLEIGKRSPGSIAAILGGDHVI